MLREKRHLFFSSLLLTTVVLAIFLTGCENEEVFLIHDVDAIKQYLQETEEGLELFRTNNLIVDTPYRLPFDDTEYRDFVDSVTRTIDVRIAGPFDFGHLGFIQEALATVRDRFFVRTQKVLGPNITEILSERDVTRYGYFLLLGDERHPFIGWKLWGFNSLGEFDAPVRLSVKTLNGGISLAANFDAYTEQPIAFSSFPYIKLYEIDTLKNNDSLVLNVSPRNPQDPRRYYHLVSAASDAGFFTKAMSRIDPQHWADTIKTPSNNPRVWNIIFVQSFLNPPGRQYSRGWCIPYRIPQ